MPETARGFVFGKRMRPRGMTRLRLLILNAQFYP
jgi:hypothetical protein